MKAIVRHEYGGTEQVAMEDRTDPVPGPGEVLVEVRAAGVDRGAWHLLHGEPRLMRLAFGVRRPKQPVLGRELAGVVAAVNESLADTPETINADPYGAGWLVEISVAVEGGDPIGALLDADAYQALVEGS